MATAAISTPQDIEVKQAAPVDDERPDFSPDNPMTEQPVLTGEFSEEEKERLKKIITDYRTGWAPDRLLRWYNWMKNQLFYRGRQILEWDANQNIWCDALALYRQSGSGVDGDDSYLEKWTCNITKMLGTAFVGTMSRAVPPTVIRPESAEIPADVATALGAQQLISIVERMNGIKGLLKKQNTCLYLYGSYFRHTRLVADGNWAGWDEVPNIEEKQRELPDRYHCSQCGMDIPAGEEVLRECPDCHAQLGPADFYPAEQGDKIEIEVGTKRVPRTMVKWTIWGPRFVDVDPMADELGQTPLLALDFEVDIGWARRTFHALADKITEGATITTTPNAAYERLRRNESFTQGWANMADTFQQKPTYSQVWLRPDCYFRDWQKPEDGKEGFAEKMLRLAPEGLKVSMIGEVVVDVRPAILDKEWSSCKLLEDAGLLSPAIADDVVPFNERLNPVMADIDDYFSYGAHGITIYDTAMIDGREIQNKPMAAGVLNGVKRKGNFEKPLSDSIWQFVPQIGPNIFAWPMQLVNFAEMISGVVRQTFGAGTQDNVETAKGQAQQLAQAQEKLNVFYDNEKEEGAAAARNAIWHIQQARKKGLITKLWEVVEANGSEFRNDYVDLDKMDGRVRVEADLDQGLPQSPEQQRDVYRELVVEAGKGNPVAAEMLDVVPNQETIAPSLYGNQIVLPRAAQRSRTEQHINALMEQDWRVDVDPQTGAPTRELPVKPEIGTDDWKTLKDTIKRFRQENFDQQPQNPDGWERLAAYYQLAEELEMQEAIQDAGRKAKVAAAGAPPPDPSKQQAAAALMRDAAIAAQDLTTIASIPPEVAIPGKALPAVVSAGSKILDAGIKAATQ